MQRLKRVFHIDIEHCGVCGGTLRVIACIDTPELIEKFLTHLAARETGGIHPPRAPPPRRAWSPNSRPPHHRARPDCVHRRVALTLRLISCTRHAACLAGSHHCRFHHISTISHRLRPRNGGAQTGNESASDHIKYSLNNPDRPVVLPILEPPVVVITSNRTREIHDAIKRRCYYHWVDYPERGTGTGDPAGARARDRRGAEPRGGGRLRPGPAGDRSVQGAGCGRDHRLGAGPSPSSTCWPCRRTWSTTPSARSSSTRTTSSASAAAKRRAFIDQVKRELRGSIAV